MSDTFSSDMRAPENALSPTFFYLDCYSGIAIVYEVAKPVRIGSVIDNESSHGDSRVADIAVPLVSPSAIVRRREINGRKTEEEEEKAKTKGLEAARHIRKLLSFVVLDHGVHHYRPDR